MRTQGHASEHSVSVLLRVEHTLLLEDLRNDGNRRVDGVRDDKDECLGGRGRDAGSEVADNACVDLRWVRHGHEI